MLQSRKDRETVSKHIACEINTERINGIQRRLALTDQAVAWLADHVFASGRRHDELHFTGEVTEEPFEPEATRLYEFRLGTTGMKRGYVAAAFTPHMLEQVQAQGHEVQAPTEETHE